MVEEAEHEELSVTDRFRAARDELVQLQHNYDGAREAFNWPRFTEFNFALDWFDATAQDLDFAARNCLVIVEADGSSTRRTFAQMSRRSNQVANWLRSIGVRRGDHMILMLGNQVELWETMLAGMKLGIVLIPTTTQMGPIDLRDRVERGQAQWAMAGSNDVGKFTDVPGSYQLIEVAPSSDWADRPQPTLKAPNAFDYRKAEEADTEFTPDAVTRADETLLLYFTSGTTSKAKLVEHTHTSYPVGHLSTMYWIGLEPGDVHLNVASPGWAKHAWSNVFAPWIAQACVFIYNYSRFDPAALMQQMEAEGVTSFCAPPTVWRMLIQADLTQLANPPRKVVSAGEPLNAEVIAQVQNAWGQTIRDGFGQTETTVQIANTPGQSVQPGAMGKPLPGYDVALVDPVTGEEGDIGEICLKLGGSSRYGRPVGLMAGYYGDQAKTNEAFRNGYYHTGDMAERDEAGTITYVGRGDDVFKSSDYRLSPFELESVLIEHVAVAEAAVVPSPDPLRLSVPKAFVVLAGTHTPSPELAEDILRYCREHLAPFKRIRRLEFAELPKTISGKIRRVELRKSEEARRADGADASGFGVEYSDSDFPGLKG